jgi:hypothetical protein
MATISPGLILIASRVTFFMTILLLKVNFLSISKGVTGYVNGEK